MKNIVSKIAVFASTLIMVATIGVSVYAYSGKLDDYSGWCGYGGLASADTFYNDDGTFYLNHEITAKDFSGGSMGIAAQESTLLGYKTRDTVFRSDIGSSRVTMYAPAGKYRLYFYTTSDLNYVKFTFRGSVYDDL